MKLRYSALCLVFTSFSAVFGQAGAPKPAPAASLPTTEAEKSFAAMKALAGTWEGTILFSSTEVKPELLPGKGKPWIIQVTLRVTSMGNAVVHEMRDPTEPDDPSLYDHPVTVFYVEGERLMLTHYCDAGNRPRMTGKLSPDGKVVSFDFVDISGPTKQGYMRDSVFTMVDGNHHTEDWTFMLPGEKPGKVHMELQRLRESTSTSAP